MSFMDTPADYGHADGEGPPMGYMGAPIGYRHASSDAYGTFMPPAVPSKAPAGAFVHSQRRRLNIVAMAMALFVPWVLFSTLYAVLSFSLHYTEPTTTYGIVGVGFLVVLLSAFFAVDAVRRKELPDGSRRQPSWYIFICVTSLLAWVLAVGAGETNFVENLQPFYDVLNLNTYQSVDPSKMRGQQLMDAGRIIFVKEATLDLSKAMSFKNLDRYCVAPVTMSSGNESHATLANYDFWAVGTNCCTDTGEFHCGDFHNPHAHAGLRLMRDEQRAFFRLAVQQAEAAHSVKAIHPLFFTWMQDPVVELNSYQDEGFKYYTVGMFSHFVLQLFLVLCAALAFSKMGTL